MWDFSIFATPEAWIALLTLTALEVVLGIDNIIFISILTDKLPENQRSSGRSIGLMAALVTRLALLFTITWIMGLQETLFSVLGEAISGRDLILGLGGLFLLFKATVEIFENVELREDATDHAQGRKVHGFAGVIFQIMLLDIVFSLDSVITAVGMSRHLLVMVIAVVIAVLIMLISAGAISRFINKNPSMKILALAFLMMIGVVLVADALGQHINKAYIYFAMTFSLGVELVNLRARKGQSKKKVEAEPAPSSNEG
jgi:predicted tellurium resistance membrane protein TerC